MTNLLSTMQRAYEKEGIDKATEIFLSKGNMLERQLAKLKFFAQTDLPMIIVGGVGSGKTTLLQWLLWQVDSEATGIVYQEIPELIPARGIKNVTNLTGNDLKERRETLSDIVCQDFEDEHLIGQIAQHYKEYGENGTSRIPVPFLAIGSVKGVEEIGLLHKAYEEGWKFFTTSTHPIAYFHDMGLVTISMQDQEIKTISY